MFDTTRGGHNPRLFRLRRSYFCAAFFGPSFSKDSHRDDELNVRRHTAKRVKTAPVSLSRVPTAAPSSSSSPAPPVVLAAPRLQRIRRRWRDGRRASSDRLPQEEPSRPRRRRHQDGRRMALQARQGSPLPLRLAPCFPQRPCDPITVTELVVVVNPYDDCSEAR
ncbi:hypothetical protein C8R46DRAFT_425553 [Mycena filopes]|nr:hypothetical protein C8R46DRAFT_425553 [Mycena filopes]